MIMHNGSGGLSLTKSTNAWDDREDRILSTDKSWSSVIMEAHAGVLLQMNMRKKCKTLNVNC